MSEHRQDKRVLLDDEDIERAAAELGLEPCILKAVCLVESAGSGFLASGNPKILFEGHIFWKELEKRGIDPKQYSGRYPNIVYRKWDRSQYLGGEAEYGRLREASAINHDAALCSASWGAFQIMGFNHELCGFATVTDYVERQKESAAAQLEAFCAFVGALNLIPALREKAWKKFAKAYNGPGYADNNYDTRLESAYAACVRAKDTDTVNTV